MDEQDDIYNTLHDYIEGAMQQGGGMWQRGGFFMTCS
jgi:hypothetical protein